MRNNKNNQNKRNPRRNNGNRANNHAPQNFDQQQNVVTTRRTKKVKDVKIPSKYWYDGQYQVSMVLGGNVRQIVLPAHGFQSDARIGNKIVTTKIELKYLVTAAPTDVYNQVRLMLIYAPNPDINILQILDYDVSVTNISPLSFTKAFSTGTMFQVLWDQSHILNTQSSNATVQGQVSIPCNLPSTWDYDQAFESGFFALVWVGDSSFSPHPSLNFNLRAQYHDL